MRECWRSPSGVLQLLLRLLMERGKMAAAGAVMAAVEAVAAAAAVAENNPGAPGWSLPSSTT